MSLNVKKCNCITFHRIKSAIIFDYKLDNIPLTRCESIRDLGVMLAQDLRPNLHIQNVCAKASRSLGLLARSSRDFDDLNSLRTLYCTLVRPLLEYNSVVWSPHQITLVRELQTIQDRFLRLLGCRMGFAFREVPIRDLEPLFNLQSLEVRRDVSGVVFLHKLVNGFVDCPELLGQIGFLCRTGTRSTDLFGRRHVSTNYDANSTLNRIQRLGNKASHHIDFFADSSTSVKRSLLRVATDELYSLRQ
ncbi:uncharacterized protein LOC128992781 [Macrosteles quadrilineatus]|uniref:uncharacterized protein LOC128992781 n=1 Tax=Macrosteles quadrilineatus TaxID=74068 RepID=UPI0023E1DDC2|nr:uncharacterized protein LOC128992781 [Macrosteles quadrilineatus]